MILLLNGRSNKLLLGIPPEHELEIALNPLGVGLLSQLQ
jgi:hypothetical protein